MNENEKEITVRSLILEEQMEFWLIKDLRIATNTNIIEYNCFDHTLQLFFLNKITGTATLRKFFTLCLSILPQKSIKAF